MKPELLHEWDDVYAEYGGPLPELLAKLEHQLETEPGLDAELMDVVVRRLDEGVDTATMGWVASAFDDLRFYRADALLSWAVRKGADVLAELELDGTAPRVTRMLRSLLARAEPRLQEAVAIMGRLPTDWKNFQRVIRFDVESERYAIRIDIGRFDGQSFWFEGDQFSLFYFAQNVTEALSVFSRPELFDESERTQFAAELDALAALLRGRGTGDEDPSAAASEPRAASPGRGTGAS